MRSVASLVLLVTLVACETSPELKNQRVPFLATQLVVLCSTPARVVTRRNRGEKTHPRRLAGASRRPRNFPVKCRLNEAHGHQPRRSLSSA